MIIRIVNQFKLIENVHDKFKKIHSSIIEVDMISVATFSTCEKYFEQVLKQFSSKT